MQTLTRYDAAIIGAGLAGSATAILLAKQGRQVVLIEKALSPHHKVCGEFLSIEAQQYLSRLGIDLAKWGAVPIKTVTFCLNHDQTAFNLPFTAMSVSRFCLDDVLLAEAQTLGVKISRGNGVKTATGDLAKPAVLTLADGQTLTANTLFLASGKTDIPGLSHRVGKHNDFIGFKMYFKLIPSQAAALNNQVDVFLFNRLQGAYAGLQPVENGLANLCLVVHKTDFARWGKQWANVLVNLTQQNPLLADRLQGATACWAKPLALSGIPYGYLYKPHGQEWYYRLGDQMACIPSFCGDGMSIALHTAFLAANASANDTTTGDSLNQYYHQATHTLGPAVTLASRLFSISLWPGSRNGMMTLFKLMPGLVNTLISSTRIPVC